MFSGMEVEDVNDWLDSFDRVSRHNNWDALTKLNNVVFYLLDVAKTWFLNHEAEFRDWEMFSSRFRDLFGRPTFRSTEAQQKLAFRVQRPEEPYTAYIEDVLALCRRVDAQMPETEKCRHLIKGIKEEAFQIIVVKNPTTVSAITDLCRALEDARRSRIRLPPIPSSTETCTSQHNLSVETLRVMIREVVREELDRRCQLPPLTGPSPAPSSKTNISDASRSH